MPFSRGSAAASSRKNHGLHPVLRCGDNLGPLGGASARFAGRSPPAQCRGSPGDGPPGGCPKGRPNLERARICPCLAMMAMTTSILSRAREIYWSHTGGAMQPLPRRFWRNGRPRMPNPGNAQRRNGKPRVTPIARCAHQHCWERPAKRRGSTPPSRASATPRNSVLRRQLGGDCLRLVGGGSDHIALPAGNAELLRRKHRNCIGGNFVPPC